MHVPLSSARLPTSFQQPLFAPKHCSDTLWMFWMYFSWWRTTWTTANWNLRLLFMWSTYHHLITLLLIHIIQMILCPSKKCSTWNNLYIKSSLKGWLIPDQMWWSRWGSRTRLRSLSGPWDGRPTQSYSGTFCRNVYTTKVSSHQTREQPCDAKKITLQKN